MRASEPAVNDTRRHWPTVYGWVAGFVVGVIVLGLAPISRPANANYLIPGYWAVAVIVTAIVSCIAMFVLGRDWLFWTIGATLGILCAFAIRIHIDVAHDRTNHNLLPFELITDIIITALQAALGAAAGEFLRSYADRDDHHGPYTPRWKRPS